MEKPENLVTSIFKGGRVIEKGNLDVCSLGLMLQVVSLEMEVSL